MNALTRYHVAERALAEAKTIPAITEVCSFYEGIRKTAHGLNDRQAEIEAAEFIIRAQRKLGEMILAAGRTEALSKGARGNPGPGRGKRGLKITRVLEPTLASLGVNKNLAHSARKVGKLPPEDFDQRLDAWKQAVSIDGNRITTKLPEPQPQEKAAAKVRANNVSLTQWKEMSKEEQRELLQPPPSDAHFNKQDSDGIEWAQNSWNPISGCEHNCKYCYARDFTQRHPDIYPHGFEPTLYPYMLYAPRNTKVPEEAIEDTRYKNVFTGSMSDIFGRWVPREWIEVVLSTVRENPQWNFLFLTKFPQRIAEFEIPPNAWMGTTVDHRKRAENAEDAFAKLREKGYCGITWVSVEPMLEPIKFKRLDLFNWIVMGGASRSSETPAFQPPFPWIVDLYVEAKALTIPVYMKTNLGIANRVLELPFNAPIKTGAMEAPPELRYWEKNPKNSRVIISYSRTKTAKREAAE